MTGAETDRTAVASLLAPVVEDLGLVLEEATVVPAGSRRVLRVVVDLPAPTAEEAGDEPAGPGVPPPPALSLDAVADVTTAVAAALDDGDVLGDRPYVLEVTSPGVDRPLRTPEHFRRNLRRRVEVRTGDGTVVTGRVLAAGSALLLDVDGAKRGMPAKRRTLAWADVERAVVQVEFNRVEQPDAQPDEQEEGD